MKGDTEKMLKGNRKVLYPRQYVTVAQHCTIYFLSKGYIEDNYSITKERFKNIFEEEYKQKYPVRANCSNILSALNFLKLIKRRNNSNPEKIYFIRNGIDTLQEKYSDEILKKHPDETLAKPRQQILVNRQSAFQTKEEKAPDIQGLHCLLCKELLSSEYELHQHILEVDHKLRSLYRNNRVALDGKLYYMDTATVSKSVKMENGECLVRLRETVNVEIVLVNNDKTLCTVTDVTLLIPTPEIQFSYCLPSDIVPGEKIQFVIKASFHEIAAVVYPVVFHISKENRKIFVLHEVVFRIQNVEVDELGPIGPYKRLSQVQVSVEYPIVSGVPPPSSKRTFPCIVPLSDYPIPADVIEMINSGFVERREMSSNVKDQLKKFLGMLKKTSKGKFIPNLNKENYSQFMKFLLHMEEHQMLIDIHKYDREEETMKLHPNKKLCILKVPGLFERRPSLMKNDRILVTIIGEPYIQYEGIVHEVREQEVYLGFREQFLKKFVENLKLSISFSVNRYPLRLEHRALMLMENHEMSWLMFPNEYSYSSDAGIRSWFNRLIETNEEQKTAVSHIVSGSFFPSPYVVFGPPGTGKTVTIVEAILQLWKNCDGARILACTPSNAAADVLTTRILQQIPNKSVLRMYADCWTGDNIPEEIKASSNFDTEEKAFYYSLEEVLKKKVVVSTLITAGRLVTAGIPAGHFTHIFVDESGHAPEPELLVPVCGLLTSSSNPGELKGRLVLAGDPRQLGPILRSVPASNLGLGTSFLERLVTANDQYKRSNTGEYNTAVITKLVKNFRSHELILKVPNDLFYYNELKACGGDLTRMACRWSQLPKREFPIIFHGVQGKDEREAHSPSYFNRQEINVVMKYVEALFEERLSGYKVQERDIGIITPYRLQVHKFRELLRKKNWQRTTVGSVEEFQGQERLIIVISTVRSSVELLDDDYKHHLGFLKNPKRFNVAVTRAKALLIVVGNPNVLQYDRSWKSLLEFCRKNGAYTGCKYQPQEEKPINDDENNGLDIAGLSLDEPSNVEDGPQWRSEM
ncbi:putative helicase MOV-10 isoform X1 [Schistocerca nitens]|uniref:putative helicase MOV-10 isoform X1 n=2 Tax=Schistocerca nitens TaxID=7011 RepID=UPI0021194E3C|nr:putative helicase MOV-10 isoform X1 [Schistocerca nitens]